MDKTSAGGGGGSYLLDFANNPYFIAAGGNGDQEKMRGAAIGLDGLSDNGVLDNLATIITRNFVGQSYTYGGLTLYGGFGNGNASDDNQGLGGGLTGSDGGRSYSYVSNTNSIININRINGNNSDSGYIKISYVG